jgi:hypothetical protein
VGFVTSNQPIKKHAQYVALSRELPVPTVPMILSGWSYTLANLLPWAQRQLLIVTGAMAVFEGLLLAVLYRDWRLWVIQEITLICPGCRKKQLLPVGDAQCPTCHLKFHIRIDEPRCPNCDYLLYMLKSDCCPECGSPIRNLANTTSAPESNQGDLNGPPS